MKKALIISGLVAVFVLAHTENTLAQSAQFSISQDLDKQNWKPAVAMNPETGDCVIVWEQHNANTSSRAVYANYCKYRGKDKFNVGKPKLVSAANGLNTNPAVAFDPASNSYLVVWSKREVTADGTPESIVARKLNAKCKLKGKETYITNLTTRSCEDPKIISTYDANGAPEDLAEYLVAWTVSSVGDKTEDMPSPGIWAAAVDSKGKRPGEYQQVYEASVIKDQSGHALIGNVTTGRPGNHVFSITCDNANDTSASYLALTNSSGKRHKLTLIANENLMSLQVARLSPKLFVCSWTGLYSAGIFHQRVKANLKKNKKEFTTASEYAFEEIAVMEIDGGGAYIVAERGDKLLICKFDARGKAQSTEITPSEYILPTFTCVKIADNKFLLITSILPTDQNGDDYELKGLLFDLPL